MAIKLNEVDKVEILTLQDNYVDMAAMDNTDIVHRRCRLMIRKLETASWPNMVFRQLLLSTQTINPALSYLTLDFPNRERPLMPTPWGWI